MKKPHTHTANLLRLPEALHELADERHWVVWSWEPRQRKDGDWTKPPRQARDPNKCARSNDPSTWGRYADAVKRWKNKEADGIGFMLLGSGIGASDLDHCCRRNAEHRKVKIDPWARELCDEANGAYREVTVSGKGLRIIGKADGPELHRRFAINGNGAGVELYRNTPRFITVSGIQLGNCTTLPPLDKFLDDVLARYEDSPARGEHHDAIDYEDIIAHGAMQGERSDLFHRVVWHLASRGRSVDEIIDELARYPEGIGAKYADRLAKEVERSYRKWQRQNPARQRDLPTIKIADGQIAHMVDQTQDALIKAELPIFVRGGRLVEPISVDREAADGRRTTTTVFAALSEEKVTYALNKHAATFVRHDARQKGWVETNPPPKVAAMLLGLRQWEFPEVIGVVGAPTMRPDGSILSAHGYDPATRLWCDANIELPPIPDRPTRKDAAAAMRLYKDLLEGFPFVNETDLSVALAAILTAILRGAFDLTPMFLVVAHDVGNGKSYLVDLFATMTTGRACPVITPGKTADELDKRLGAILLEGGTVVSLDNLSFDLESDLLCQVLTQPIVKTRILGQSVVPECEWRGTIFGTGNNIRVVGDLVRRTLTCNLDAKVERPELREFAFDPIARVHADRGSYIAAAITIARAYRAFGDTAAGYRPLAGYAAWSKMVREPLLWLGERDPVGSMELMRASDPKRAAAYELVRRWERRIGLGKVVSVRDIITVANHTKERSQSYRFPKFRSLLLEHAGMTKGDAIDPVRLGKWLHREHGRVYDGLRIDQITKKGKAVNQYVLVKVEDGFTQ
jgi:putative DNA primase/helicase